MFSNDTVQLFAELLNSYQLPANHPQFELIAARIAIARKELSAWQEEQKTDEAQIKED